MTRRDFLQAGISAALLPSVGRASSGVPDREPPVPVIDAHIHLYDPTRPEGVPWPPANNPLLFAPHLPEKFRATAAPCGVVGAIVVEASEWVEDNQWLLDLARDNPELVGVIGNLRPGRPDFAAHLHRFASNPLFRGVRIKAGDLARLDEPAVENDLGRISDADLAVDVLGGVAILPPTLALSRRFPRLRIVVNHLPFKEWDGNVAAMRRALTGLASRPEVYLKVSDVVRLVDGRAVGNPAHHRAALDGLCEQFGAHRLVHGSNWPVSGRTAPYEIGHRVVADYFRARGRSAAEDFFFRNSVSAYRWRPRGPAGPQAGT